MPSSDFKAGLGKISITRLVRVSVGIVEWGNAYCHDRLEIVPLVVTHRR
jgi:hypothetical protein